MKKPTWITIFVLVGLLLISIFIIWSTTGSLQRVKAERKSVELAFDNFIAGELSQWEGRLMVLHGQLQQRGGYPYDKEITALSAQFDFVRKSLAESKKKTGKNWLAQKEKTIRLFNEAENSYNQLRDQLKW